MVLSPDERSHVLVLGGTTEARALVLDLVDVPGLRVTTSVPPSRDVPLAPVGAVHRGGFGGAEGLARWSARHGVTLVVDATSPFAARASATAVGACALTGTPLLQVERPAWLAQPGDDWRPVPDVAAAAEALAAGPWARALVAAGAWAVGPLGRLDRPVLVLRLPSLPSAALPRGCEVVLRRRGADVDGEVALLRERRVDVVVTTDSGGPGGAAVLVAARELGLPVVVVQRPAAPRHAAVPVERAGHAAEAAAWVRARVGVPAGSLVR